MTSLGLALVVLAATPGAAATAGETGCGLVAVHLSREDYWSLNRVAASGVSCSAARGLVRSWAVAVAAGRIPGGVTAGAVSAGGVIVFGRFGPPGRFEGYTCRWMNVKPGPHESYLPGQGRRSSGGAVVTWAFRAASNPTLGQVRGCPGGVVVGHAVASTIRARAVSCASAKGMIRYLLVHRVIRSGRSGLRLVRGVALGFRLSHHGLEFRAQHGQGWFSFRCTGPHAVAEMEGGWSMKPRSVSRALACRIAVGHTYTEWDKLLRFGRSYGWRVVRYTG